MRNFIAGLVVLLCGINAVIAQDYNELWRKVEKLEVENNITDASEILDNIYKKANRKNDDAQLIKVFLFRSKFKLINVENAQVNIINELDKQIDGSSFPESNIYISLKAQLLEQYLTANRYRINNRTAMDDAGDDFKTWDIKTFYARLSDLFQASLEKSDKLAKVPAGDYDVIMNINPLSRKYRPSLLDILAQEALEFYKTSAYGITMPKDAFTLTVSNAFLPTQEILNLKRPVNDTIYSKYDVLRLYAQLEQLHKKRKETAPFLSIINERFNYARSQISSSQEIAEFENGIQHLIYEYAAVPEVTLLQYSLAQYYYTVSKNGETEEQKAYRTNAIKLAKSAIEKYPETLGSVNCTNLLSIIYAPKLSTQLQQNVLPNQPYRGVTSYQNVTHATVYFIRVPHDFDRIKGNRDSIHNAYFQKAREKNNFAQIKKLNLPQGDDTFLHTYEFALSGMDMGTYLVLLNANDQKKMKAGSVLKVTDIALTTSMTSNQTTITATSRNTGKPLTNVSYNIYRGNKSYTSFHGKTDKNGQVDFTLPRRYYQYSLEAINQGDTVRTSLSRGYFSKYRESDYRNVKVYTYLDRAIYRPGQKVYYKSILVENKNGESKVVSNKKLTVTVDNASGDEVFETAVETNEFGSVNGSFILPEDGLTGSFSIDIDYDDEDSYWDLIDDFDAGYVSFKVEEYKRPRFKTEFEPVTQTYVFGDSVTVTGKAKALLGSNITGAQVIYNVTQAIHNVPDSDNIPYLRRTYSHEPDPIIATDTITTDASGKFDITFKSGEKIANDVDLRNLIYNYTIDVSVTDVNGETRKAYTGVRVGEKPIEIKMLVQGPISVENNTVKLQAQNLNGEVVKANIELQVRRSSAADHVVIEDQLNDAKFHELSVEEYRKMFPYAELRKEEQLEDWKDAPILFKKTTTTDSLATIELPITREWKNGTYILYAKAVEADNNLSLEKEEDFVDEKRDVEIWANKDRPAQPSIVTHSAIYNDDQAVVDFYTSADGVFMYLTTYDLKKVIDTRWIYLNNGKTTMSFPMKNINGRTLKFQYSVQKLGQFTSQQFEVTKPVAPRQQFTIATQTFRQKLYPGEPEEWSFTIKDQDKTSMQAEVLASMYDKSLDEFATKAWRGIGLYNYAGVLEIEKPRSLLASQSINVFYHFLQNPKPTLNDDRESFNLHGLSFENFDYYYGNYKRGIQRKFINFKPEIGFIVGKVTDASGEPILGATVIVSGNDDSVTTDFDGNYKIKANIGDTIEYTFSGYDEKTITAGSLVQNAVLSASLEAVVVTGYRTTSRRMSNVASTTISSDMEEVQAESALQGQVAGLEIITSSGQPGANSMVKIRGAASLNGSAEPLYIVDGKIVDEATFKALNPNDIQEVAVLKDAGATAIYGSRGSNGVIIISTKEGVTAADLANQAAAFQQIEVRKNLNETAFFLPELYTDKDGNLKFSFTSPEALTLWKFRLFAHNKQAQTAQFEGLVRTQKELSLVPNPPRFLRETDTIRFSTKIANLSGKIMNGKATLQLFDAITMQPIDEKLGNNKSVKNFDAPINGNASVDWTFHVPIGTQAVTYRVLATAGNFSDGEENTLPVLTNRMLVTESRALWVRSGETASVTMDKLANTTSSTRANHQLTFEYTSNPSWYAIKSLPYLMEYEHECAEQTFSRFYANSVAAHVLNSNPKVKDVFDSWAANDGLKSNLEKNEELKSIILAHTPWLRDAQSEAEKQQRLATLFDLDKTAREKKKILAQLEAKQLSSGYFPWFSGGSKSEYITRHIAAGIGHLNQLNINDGDRPQTDRMYNNAIKALDKDWKDRFERHLRNNKTLDKFNFGMSYWHYQYARSFGNDNSLSGLLKDGRELAFAKAKSSYSSQSIYQQLLMAISLYRNGQQQLAQKIVEGLPQTAVNSPENGMYWKENTNGYNWYSSDIETQALAIEVFTELDRDKKEVEELKVWLLQNKRPNRWKSTKATADATYALLLQGNKWLDVKENTQIKWAGKAIPDSLMNAVQKEAGTGYFKVSLNDKAVTPDYATVEVKNKSEVPSYGGLYWQYFENLDKITIDDDLPMSVKKKLFKKINTDTGQKLIPITANDPLTIGDLITVRIEIRSTKDLDFVHLKDMRASGFEPVDVLSKYKYHDGLGYYQSTKDVATNFFFDQLRPGTYVFEYDVRAYNAGQFSNGITQLECMYAPEYSSHSEGIRVVIEE
ncbi:alpha-2-macroglobulin family protein [Nonlabens ponticola]|uniref:Alpha-2-macroglobulin n=1 Tax=Nonlabens ponticola TaxID=2496866 RepID=A0A3S9MUK8_9FLAO|nr:MG2 domain-containing protein [Nonlabens ponticola]AZQ42867.1 alpha-2-macroglobulin [Nonlabens ponticola]